MPDARPDGVVLQHVRKFRIYVTFPHLHNLIQSDEVLATELGKLDRPSAEVIVRKGKHCRLWNYMGKLDAMPAMRALKSLICSNRAQG